MISRTSDPAIRKRLAVGILLVMALLLLLTAIGYMRAGKAKAKPTIGLMTTLPLRWAEGEMSTALDPTVKPSGAYERLSGAYKIALFDNFDTLSSIKPKVLILAQPRALAPRELVQLDDWVRGGGKLLIFADPALAWESSYPLGDARRPLFTSLLSPLFAHWGLDLVLPMDGVKANEVRRIGSLSVRMPTPGAWQVHEGSAMSACLVSSNTVIAECKIGRGRAVLVADADLINEDQWQGTGARALTGTDDFDNMEWTLAIIDALHSGDSLGEFMG
jgi:ABC-type uncharacterized transport system